MQFSRLAVPAVLALAATLVLACPASADETGVHDWFGPYIGTTAGYGLGTAGFSDAWLLGIGGSTAGGVAGIEAGVDWQSGGLVLGIATDLAWAGINTDKFTTAFYDVTFGVDWLGTTTGRVGAAMKGVLVYAEAGLAYGQASISGVVFGPSDIPFDNADWSVGWTAGAGIELALGANMALKLEYNYVDLGGFVSPIPMGGDFGHDSQLHIGKIGLNYRF